MFFYPFSDDFSRKSGVRKPFSDLLGLERLHDIPCAD